MAITFDSLRNTFNDFLFTFNGNPKPTKAKIICINCQEFNLLTMVITEVVVIQSIDKIPVTTQVELDDNIAMLFKIEEYIKYDIQISE